MNHEPAASLEHAFSRAIYEVRFGETDYSIGIGDSPPTPVAEWIAHCAAYGTAWAITGHNPHGRAATDADNRARQAWLAGRIRRPGWSVKAGRNRDPSGDWPDEPTFWVAGADEAAMRGLAACLGQAALVAFRRDRSFLVWIEARPSD